MGSHEAVVGTSKLGKTTTQKTGKTNRVNAHHEISTFSRFNLTDVTERREQPKV